MYFFSNVIPVKGYNRSVIYDLHRGNYELIPNALFNSIKVSGSLHKIETTNKKYLEFLKRKEFVFDIKPAEKAYFPSLKLDWDHPSIITNTLVHLEYLDCSLLKLLSELNVKTMGIIISEQEPFDKINHLLNVNVLKHYSLQSFTIILFKSDSRITGLLKANPFVSRIIYIDGTLKENRMVLNNPSIKLYSEAQRHHTYFNRKLYIDENGIIKNAPTSTETFGKIGDIKTGLQLKVLIRSKRFQEYWFANKAICDVCRDCEFRFMCLDNRLPVKRSKHSWYHTNECNYNPYISKWKNEKGYMTLAACDIHSTKNGFTINKSKLSQVNKKLWNN